MKELITNPYSFDTYKVERNRHGQAVVTAKIMKAGRLKYQDKNGKIFHGNITLDGLNKAASTAKLKPVTIKHPPQLLTPEDVSHYQEGMSADDFKVESVDGEDWLVGSLVLTTERAIKTAEDGKLGVSAGYFRFDNDEAKFDENGDLDFSPDINHIAIGCDNPRAEGASISLDEAEDDSARIYSFAEKQQITPKHEVSRMKEKLSAVKVGALSMDEAQIEYDEAESKNAIEVLRSREDVIVAHVNAMQESMDNMAKEHEQAIGDLSGENKGLSAKVEELEKEKENMVSLDDLDALVQERSEIQADLDARGIKETFKTILEGKKMVVVHDFPNRSFDDSEIDGAYKTRNVDEKDMAERAKSKKALAGVQNNSMDSGNKVSYSQVSIAAIKRNRELQKRRVS